MTRANHPFTTMRLVGAVLLLASAQGLAQDQAAAPPRRVVEEIVVTANRRTQNLQDIASSITVLSGEDLERSSSAGFEDFVFKIPGADLVDDGLTKKLAVRGVSNIGSYLGFGTASPIGLYMNDTPIQGNGSIPDLDLYDLQRVEVLKGPQGTLYGEGSQGGAFRMLLNTADPSELLVKGEAGVGQTVNGSGFDHFQKVAVNVPLVGSWATRVVATRRHDQGYIDFPNRGTEGENDATNLMARLHVDGDLWEGFSLSAMLFYQRQRLDQFPTVQFSEGDLKNGDLEPQFQDTDFTLGGLTLDYDFGFATLTSSSSLFLNDRVLLNRASVVTNTAGPPPEGFDLPAAEEEWLDYKGDQVGFAQELRLLSNGDQWIDWIVGAFYRKRTHDFRIVLNNDEVSDIPPPVGPGLVENTAEERFEQIALFGEATLKLPWNLEFGVGLRAFREVIGLEGFFGFRGPFYPIAASQGELDGDLPPESFEVTTTAITPKFSLTWLADDSRMFYIQAAQGVRSGGVNTTALYVDTPISFDPDSLWSYEIGVKTQWFDGLLTANAAVFYNDWRDLQLLTPVPATIRGPIPVPTTDSPVLNVGRAFTRGVEFDLFALPLEDLTLGFNLFLGDGEIVEGDEGGNVADHTPMPQLSRLSYAASASYTASQWPLFGFTPFVSFDTQSTADRSALAYTSLAYVLPAFQSYNALIGFSSDRWDATFGVKNITDVRPVLGSNALEPDTVTVGRPRTWVARIAFNF